jgi:SAM-dependent methyltransferase
MNESESNRDLKDYLESYLKLPFERIAENFRRIEVLKTLDKIGTARLAEIGCGVDSIFNHLDINVSGLIVEPIQDLIDLQTNLNSNVIKVCSRLEKHTFDFAHPLDTVLMSSILHEIEEPNSFLKSAVDLLGHEGHVICVVPNAYSIHRLIGWKKGILDTPESRTATQETMQQRQLTFTPESITDLFTSLDLHVVECRTFFPKLLSHAQMQDLLNRNAIDQQFIEILYGLSNFLEPVGSEIIIVGKKK